MTGHKTPSTPPKVQPSLPHEMKFGFIASLRYAVDGIFRTLLTQRNMRIHWVSGLAVMLVGMALPLELASRATVIFCVLMVLAMEALNSAFESLVDLHVQQFERHAMVAKDAAAAAVLIFAVGAVVVFSDVLFHRWSMVTTSEAAVMRTVMWGVPLLALVAGTLWLKRSIPLMIVLGLGSLGTLTYLAFHSRDEIFSLCALAFVLGASAARWREPHLLR